MTDKEGKKRGVSMNRSKPGIKERSPDGISLPNQNTVLINIIIIIYHDFLPPPRRVVMSSQITHTHTHTQSSRFTP